MDDELTFSDHISDICKKASKKVGELARLRNLIPEDQTSVVPDSSSSPSDPLSNCMAFLQVSDRRKLERVQERALTVAFNNKMDTYSRRSPISRGELSSLYNRRLQDITFLMYKVRNGLTPDYIAEPF